MIQLNALSSEEPVACKFYVNLFNVPFLFLSVVKNFFNDVLTEYFLHSHRFFTGNSFSEVDV